MTDVPISTKYILWHFFFGILLWLVAIKNGILVFYYDLWVMTLISNILGFGNFSGILRIDFFHRNFMFFAMNVWPIPHRLGIKKID